MFMLCPTGLGWWCALIKIPGRGNSVGKRGGWDSYHLTFHCLSPKPCSCSIQSKSLYTFLKGKKIKEEEVTEWPYPFSLKTAQVLPTMFLHMLLASCQSLGHDDAKGDGNHVCRCHSGNVSLHERSRRKSEYSLHSLQQSTCEVLQVSRHSLIGKYLYFSLLDTQDL